MARRKLRNLDARILKKTLYYGALLGIDKISTKKIAEDIGITEPTIYVHFRTRANLLYEGYRTAIKQVFAEFANENSPTETRFFHALQSAKNNVEAAIYAYYYRQLNLSDEYDKIFDEFFAEPSPLKASVVEHFLYRIAVGSLVPSEEVAAEIFGLIQKL